ncbi:unnamed protein product [Penicillium viridicatum]
MDANTMENDKGLNTVIEDTTIADKANTTETGTGDPVPKKKKKSHSQAYYDRRKTREYKDQRRERRRLRKAGVEVPLPPPRVRDPTLPPKAKRSYRKPGRRRAKKAKKAAEAAAEPSQNPPAATTAALPPTTTTHPTSLEVGLLSGDKDEKIKEAEGRVGFGSADMTLPFRGKTSV